MFFFSLFLCYITHVVISHRNGLINPSNMAIWVNSTHGCLHTQCCRLFIYTDVNIRTCSTSCDGGSGSFNSSSSHSPLSTQLFLYFFTLVDWFFFSFNKLQQGKTVLKCSSLVFSKCIIQLSIYSIWAEHFNKLLTDRTCMNMDSAFSSQKEVLSALINKT